MKALKKLNKIIEELNGTLLEREDEIKAVAVAMLAEENVFVIGVPGVAKSFMFREFFARIKDAKYFERLLTKTTVPEELFGAVDLKKYSEDGEFIRNTDGMLPRAHFAFLDEPGKASSSILNTLLTIMNERLFHNGGNVERCPLRMLASASNEFFDGAELDALYDRYLIRLEARPLVHERLRLLQGAEKVESPTTITLDELGLLHVACADVTIPERIFRKLLTIQSKLGSEGIYFSDRTLYKVGADKDRNGNPRANVLKACALLAGRDSVIEDDLTVLRHIVWKTIEEKDKATQIILKLANPFSFKAAEFLKEAAELRDSVLSEEAKAADPKETEAKATEVSGRLTEILDEIEQILEDPIHARQHKKLKVARLTIQGLHKEVLSTFLEV